MKTKHEVATKMIMDCIPERQKPEQPDQLLEAEAPFHKKISIREIKSVKTNDKSAVNKESKCPLRRRERLWIKICNRTIDILAAAANVPQNTQYHQPRSHSLPEQIKRTRVQQLWPSSSIREE